MSQNPTIRVLSYNIHKGFSLGNRRFVLKSISEALKRVSADIVFLQEVQGEHKRRAQQQEDWPGLSQFEFLADRIWPYFAYGQNAVYHAGHHGNAILSKFPILEWSNRNVSTNILEQRGLLHAIVQPSQMRKPLHCICVHLNMLKRGRMKQLSSLSESVETTVPIVRPLIIAGDFNDWSVRASRFLMQQLRVEEVFKTVYGKHSNTFPSRYPLLKLDRIYYRGLTPLYGEVLHGKPWNMLSDHAALLAEFHLLPARPAA